MEDYSRVEQEWRIIMKASLMCSLAKLRRRKLPNLFLGICIFITTALSVNALVLFTELDSIFDSAYAQM